MSTDSTPSNRENARTLMLVVLAIAAATAWLLPADGAYGLLIGFVLGAVFLFALWMHDTPRWDRPIESAAESAVEAFDFNPVLADSLRYYWERRSMGNPKGWDHVLRIVNRAAEAGFWDGSATPAQIEDARHVLADLHEAEVRHG